MRAATASRSAKGRISRAYYDDPAPPRPQPMPDPPPDPFANPNSDPGPPPQDKGSPSEGKRKKRSDYTYKAWEKFLCRLPDRKSELAKNIEAEKKAVDQTPGDGLQFHENAFASWEQAANKCRAKVDAIVKECERLNQRYRDTIFDIELDDFCVLSLDGQYPKGQAVDPLDDLPRFVKRVADVFDDPQFFIDGATANDVHQGASGDCWFLAALMAVSAMKQELIEKRLCVARDEKVDVYGFVFFRDGEWIYEIVDGRVFVKVGDNEILTLLRNWNRDAKDVSFVDFSEDKYDDLKAQLQRGGEALYFSHCKSSETWLPLIEKAYAKAHGDYYSIEGGFTSEGIEDLTGGVGVILQADEIMDKDKFWNEQLSQVNKKYLFGGSTRAETKGIFASHAYAVLHAWEGKDKDGKTRRLLKIRNPWGKGEWEGDWSDGSKQWTADMMQKLDHSFGNDGVFWMSYEDFLKRYSNINRVRLFSEDWQVSQCWTCVNVPWAVDYLDTKFVFTTTEKCSVVIVLSQPDDRYFWALRGRYFYAMHFQVYKEDDSEGKWIVRSMHSSGAEPEFTRSVSAEIEDLEPGTYRVVFKITAQRQQDAPTSEEAILKWAKERKEKLLSVGRRFDYAQSKGNLQAMEKANKAQSFQVFKEYAKTIQQKERRAIRLNNEKKRKRKKRVDDAMREMKSGLKKIGQGSEGSMDAQADSRVTHRKSEFKTSLTPSTEDSKLREEGDARSTDDRAEQKVPADGMTTTEVSVGNEPEPLGSSLDQAEEVKEAQTGIDTLANAVDSPSRETTLDAREVQSHISTAKGDYRPIADDEEDLDEQFANLDLRDSPPPDRRGMYIPREDPDDSPIEQLNDNDFDWDSDLDDDVYLTDADDDETVRRYNLSANNDIFDRDSWNAMCVLGLRVYAHKATAKLEVVKGKNSS